jgi:hypothetical protein
MARGRCGGGDLSCGIGEAGLAALGWTFHDSTPCASRGCLSKGAHGARSPGGPRCRRTLAPVVDRRDMKAPLTRLPATPYASARRFRTRSRFAPTTFGNPVGRSRASARTTPNRPVPRAGETSSGDFASRTRHDRPCREQASSATAATVNALAGTPRTDPYLRDHLARLLPRVQTIRGWSGWGCGSRTVRCGSEPPDNIPHSSSTAAANWSSGPGTGPAVATFAAAGAITSCDDSVFNPACGAWHPDLRTVGNYVAPWSPVLAASRLRHRAPLVDETHPTATPGDPRQRLTRS